MQAPAQHVSVATVHQRIETALLRSRVAGIVRAQPHGAQRWRQGEGNKHGKQDCRSGYHSKAEQVLSDRSRDEHNGQEDHHERERCRHHGQADFARRLAGSLAGRNAFFLDVPEDVFEHDDGIVDDDTGRQRQRQQRHVVEREAENLHHRERSDQRDRNGGRRNNRAAEVTQEQKYDQGRQNASIDQVMLYIVDRPADKSGLISPRRDHEIGRQRRLDRIEPRHDGIDHGHGIGSGLFSDFERNRWFAIDSRNPAYFLNRVLYASNIAQSDYGSVLL